METKRRRGVNAAPAMTTRRFNAHLREDALQRLMVHAVMTRRNPGDLLSELIDLHLRQFSMPGNLAGRANSRQLSNSALDAGSVNLEAEIAA